MFLLRMWKKPVPPRPAVHINPSSSQIRLPASASLYDEEILKDRIRGCIFGRILCLRNCV